MKKCQIIFFLPVDKTVVKRTWSHFLSAACRLGVLPDTMYRTGNSKREALSKPVELTNPDQVAGFLDFVLRERNWPEFIASSLWAETGNKGRGFNVTFHGGTRERGIVYFITLSLPDDKRGVEGLISELRREGGRPILVFRFKDYTSKNEAVSEEDGVWVDRESDWERYEEIALKSGFKKKFL
jgi:hypothetical protein